VGIRTTRAYAETAVVTTKPNELRKPIYSVKAEVGPGERLFRVAQNVTR
jgi:hypothetical protein